MAPRLTVQTQLILQAFLKSPADETWGRKLAEQTGLMSGTTQPILMRLEAVGWLVSRREDAAEAHSDGRPPRRYYRLTDEGAARVPEALANASRPARSALRDLAGEGGLA